MHPSIRSNNQTALRVSGCWGGGLDPARFVRVKFSTPPARARLLFPASGNGRRSQRRSPTGAAPDGVFSTGEAQGRREGERSLRRPVP